VEFIHRLAKLTHVRQVIPIIERGLRERGADTKKKAAQIVGNLASLTDSKDFVPYLSGLLPLVHVVLVDPVPEARATAAKALGTLVERLGEVHFPDLVPGLLRTLKTDTSGVDRQGAAQGLSEVLSGLGMDRLEGLLPDIIANAQSPRSTVREGFMSLLVFLPATFGTRFQPHLPKIISPILSGLADSEEYVREAAMRAGRMIVSNYSSKAIDLLLPELEQGMFDPGWRIRVSLKLAHAQSMLMYPDLSNHPSPLLASCYSRYLESAEKRRSMTTTTKWPNPQLLNHQSGLSLRYSEPNAGIVSYQHYISHVKMPSMWSARHLFTYGRFWWPILLELVCFQTFRNSCFTNLICAVREILPQLIGQIIYLISGSEFEQQEVSCSLTPAFACTSNLL